MEGRLEGKIDILVVRLLINDESIYFFKLDSVSEDYKLNYKEMLDLYGNEEN